MRLCTKRTDGGHCLALAWASMPADPSTATISACGATASSAAVEAPVPHPASSNRSPCPWCCNLMRCADMRRCT